MEQCLVTLSANAGIALHIGNVKIWVDAIHDEKYLNYDTVSQQLWNTMQTAQAFKEPNMICFTHCHQDHYSQRLTLSAKRRWPNAKLIIPAKHFDDQIFLFEDEMELSVDRVNIKFIKIPHEGAEFKNVSNYGILISNEEFRIFLAGDSEIASEKMIDLLKDTHIDLAILNFPWITLGRGREFINNTLKPEHILVYHLPREDAFGYLSATKRLLTRIECKDVRILTQPLEQELYYFKKLSGCND